ncbi:MAG: hypothetical protein J6M06_04220, partial [Synergistaceae bacterium]|nr:hypothetical protein [Synergistaceae bacterium]
MIRLSHIKFRTKWQLFLDKVLLYAVISCVPLCWIGIPACLLTQSRPVTVETRVIHEPAPVPEEKQPDTAAWNLYKEKGDTPEGLLALLKAAESGMPDAAALMGKFYEEGK